MTASAPHVEVRGAGTPVVFVHGNGVDHRILLPLDEVFQAAGGWRRVFVDLPGFGRTARLPAPGGLPEVAAWLDEVVGRSVGAQPFAVVGSSLGGLLARRIAARAGRRCIGLGLLAPVVDPDSERRTLPRRAAAVIEDPGLLASLAPADAARYAESAVVQSPANWTRFREQVLPGLRLADPRAMARLQRNYRLPDFADVDVDVDVDVASIARPTLVVAGRQDDVVGFVDQQRLATLLGTTAHVLDPCGHNPLVDQPDEVAALVAGWSSQVRSAAA